MREYFGHHAVVGKKLSELGDYNWGTCFPIVNQAEIGNSDAIIVGVEWAEFGSENSQGQQWENNGNVGWYVD